MAKSIKKAVSAVVVAAPKKADHVTAIKTLAAQYTAKSSNAVGALQLEYALKAREVIKADPDAVIKPLSDAFGKQRKAELMRVVNCDNDDMLKEAQVLAKGRNKAGLQQVARVLQMQHYNVAGGKIDLASKEARKYITSGARVDFLIAAGKEPEAAKKQVESDKAAAKTSRATGGATKAATVKAATVKADDKAAHNEGNVWIEFEQVLAKLEKTYKDDKRLSPIVSAGAAGIKGILAGLVAATAE